MNTKLEGKNQIRLFRHVAETLVSKIRVYKNVAGIIYLGGLTRGFADKYSDVDIIILLNKRDESLRRNIRTMVLEEAKRSNIDIDLETHYLKDFGSWKWDEIDRWDFSKAEIVFDPTGRIRRMIQTKLKIPEGFWVRRIVTCAEYMKWYCCPPKTDVGTIVEAWVSRGDLVSAHYCLNYAVDLLLKSVFAVNKEFLPAQKWRIHYFQNLKWLPKNHKLLDEAINIRELTKEDLTRRLKALRKLWKAVLPKIKQETGLTPDQMTKHFVEIVLRQGPFH